MPIAAATGIFLAKYSLQQTQQTQARMIRVRCNDLDTTALTTILRALAAEHGMQETDIHLSGVERVHGVLEWVDDDESAAQTAAPRGPQATTASRKSR